MDNAVADEFVIEEGLPMARPWPRYWARMLDVTLEGVVVAILLWALFPGVMQSIDDTLGGQLSGVPIIFCALILDVAVVSLFGNSPGKWAMGISLQAIDEECLTAGKLLERNGRIFFAGLGLALPLISLFTLAHNHSQVRTGQLTSWDKDLGTRVYDIKTTPYRLWSVVIVYALLVAGLSVVAASG